MLCESSSTSSSDPIQRTVIKSVLNEKKQLSFVYQPGIGFYDKKKNHLELDQRRLSTEKFDENIPTKYGEFLCIHQLNLHFSQENHHKRKIDQHLSPLKKSRPSDASMEIISTPTESHRKSHDRSQKHCSTPTIKGISRFEIIKHLFNRRNTQ